MIKEKLGYNLNGIVKSWHGLNPFCQVINDDYDAFMAIARVRLTLHEVDPPFAEIINGHDGVEWIWGDVLIVYLTFTM